ncbi:hypothetical protein CEP54_012657 [Fusarium duplospermum]|uniref:Uncharacterized protein n=1 Tax=Fusarium duplospermum TaxID=1325734 RepID=A0A428P7E5_9HYPO|nr:hypothetical protein CEP54_012657 [Fusarium duplospermum]
MHTSKAIDAAVRVIPDSSVNVNHWWRHKNLRKLNLLLIIPLMSFFTIGVFAAFTMLALYVIPIGRENIGWKFYTIFAPWVLVEVIVVFFTFPETKGPSIEDITIIFDGEGSANSQVSKVVDAERGETVEVVENVGQEKK